MPKSTYIVNTHLFSISLCDKIADVSIKYVFVNLFEKLVVFVCDNLGLVRDRQTFTYRLNVKMLFYMAKQYLYMLN